MTTCPNCQTTRLRALSICPHCLDGPWRIIKEWPDIPATRQPATRQPATQETYVTREQAQAVVDTLQPLFPGRWFRVERVE